MPQRSDTARGSERVRKRVATFDWQGIAASLDERGHARLPQLLEPAECVALRNRYDEREDYRSFVDLAQHRFGEGGDYRYFANPLPPLVRALRRHLYVKLRPIANEWETRLGVEERWPQRLSQLAVTCEENEQRKPTCLVLRYGEGGLNHLHQDVYGPVVFPLQVAVLLSPRSDFEGGEFLLAEQRPRTQTRVEAVTLEQGEGLVFPSRVRPSPGSRGWQRVAVRHGASRVHTGERFVLGVIFHDAR